MKIRRIYCGDKDRFHNIVFSDGFNVIQADITDRRDKKKDTHNLGKTLLIHLIDFLISLFQKAVFREVLRALNSLPFCKIE